MAKKNPDKRRKIKIKIFNEEIKKMTEKDNWKLYIVAEKIKKELKLS